MTSSAAGSKRVTLLAERTLPSESAPETSSPTAMDEEPKKSPGTATAPTSQASRPAFLEQMTAVMTAIAMMLAARMILFFATAGAFVLTYLAINQGTTTALIAAGTYDVLVVCPMVWLYLQRG